VRYSEKKTLQIDNEQQDIRLVLK